MLALLEVFELRFVLCDNNIAAFFSSLNDISFLLLLGGEKKRTPLSIPRARSSFFRRACRPSSYWLLSPSHALFFLKISKSTAMSYKEKKHAEFYKV
jgi:hypothetical protein